MPARKVLRKDAFVEQRLLEIEKNVNEILDSDENIKDSMKIETVIKRKVVDKRAQQELVEREKEEKRREEERKQRINERKKPMQWDKNLKKYVPVPEIGEIESWRER